MLVFLALNGTLKENGPLNVHISKMATVKYKVNCSLIAIFNIVGM